MDACIPLALQSQAEAGADEGTQLLFSETEESFVTWQLCQCSWPRCSSAVMTSVNGELSYQDEDP